MMRRITAIVFLLLVVSIANAQQAGTGFIIEGKIKAVPDNSTVFLTGFNSNDTLVKTTVQKGIFMLKGKVENEDARVLNFPSLNRKLVVFMGNDNIQVKSDSANFNDLMITGSASNRDYEEFLYHIKPLNDYVDYYRNILQSAPAQNTKDSLSIVLNTAYNLYEESIDRFLSRKKTSPVAALLLAYSYDTDPNKDVILLEKRFQILTGEATQSQFAKNITQVITNDKIGAIGTPAADFTQTDTSGKKISLSQFKGKYVLLDFWASWCRPCRMENPNVVAAYNSYKNKNFTIVSVSLDERRESWINAIANDRLNWTHLSDLKYWSNAVAMQYHIQSIPQNFLIDPNGIIIAKNLRGEELAARLKQLLK